MGLLSMASKLTLLGPRNLDTPVEPAANLRAFICIDELVKKTPDSVRRFILL